MSFTEMESCNSSCEHDRNPLYAVCQRAATVQVWLGNVNSVIVTVTVTVRALDFNPLCSWFVISILQ
jgi:hypothetical protein